MLPESAASLETSYTVKMMAIVKQWDVASGCHTDNTDKYLILVLSKSGMDAVVLYLCYRKLNTSFLSMCSLSIILADLVMVFFIASLLFLGPARYLGSLCFFLANASATYGALPLPIMCLGLLDYCLEVTSLGNQSALCKLLRNLVLTLLVWILAVINPFGSVNSDLIELDYNKETTLIVCEVEESTLLTYMISGLSTVVICVMLPFWSMIPKWMEKAERLSDASEERVNPSKMLFTSTKVNVTQTGEENYLEETIQPCPPLWASLMLCFGTFWMPYLAVSVACLICGFGVPSYITVNMLWLECTNSFLMGLVFWIKSNEQGPYSQLPEGVCMWHVYWHLSKGTGQQQLPIAVFNPSKGKRKTVLDV
ncbi:probable G-protein coupled receptor 160 [Etheostoma spectabile]|uniref:probable G-protein coupled receptor 160 n=1 Tax=Etheostoma spectabile TaxID=54343 RepID=UPI0013AF9101|nr:probable G-protein coupled receptor 160 [Etheostoma spectabile]XP_032377623.1 probable G-protein coupled receptor 160 [Etheostoma spectabile]XP_032377624.1 probable G-protein coupled receptor 160 [Etheostoma spectabile]XP_032377625.1 probable G-protein coupled receptor 160 [Etheostoma spectabile]